jgi:uncharacterized coiled-coil protein SlyX
MNNNLDQTWDEQSPSKHLRPARRRWRWLLLVVVVALSGSGVVYAWPEIASLVPLLGHQTPPEQMTVGDKEAVPELLAGQQKIEEDLATLSKSVVDQQEQVRAIVDQLIALTSKVDALQRPAPAPTPPAPIIAEQPRASIAQTTPKPKKPPLRPSVHSGPISVGGAPLNATPSDTAN